MTTLKVHQIKSLKEKFNRLINDKAPTNDIKRLSKYILREENLYIKKLERQNKKLANENKKLKKKANKKADKLRLKEDKNKKQYYHINAYIYSESDKTLNDETGEYEYKTPYDYADKNKIQYIGKTRIENAKNINTTIEKKYIDNFDENTLYYCLIDRQ